MRGVVITGGQYVRRAGDHNRRFMIWISLHTTIFNTLKLKTKQLLIVVHSQY